MPSPRRAGVTVLHDLIDAPSGWIEKSAVVGMDDVPSPSPQNDVAKGGWQVAGVIPAVRLQEDPLRARSAPSLKSCRCPSDAAPGGEVVGEYQAVFERHGGAFGHVGCRRVRGVPDEQNRSP